MALGFFGTLLVTAFVSAASAIAMSWLMRPDDDVDRPGVKVPKEGSDHHLPVVYGTREVGAISVYKWVHGADNVNLTIIAAFCHGPVSEILDIKMDGVSYTDESISDWVTVDKRTGELNQDAVLVGQILVPPYSTWNRKLLAGENNRPGNNVCYAKITLRMDKSQEVWRGEPRITAVIKGKEVYDWRTATTGYSENSAVCAYDYLTDSVYGRGIDPSKINLPEFTAAADFCDESVSNTVNFQEFTEEMDPGSYEWSVALAEGSRVQSDARYSINAALDTEKKVFDNYKEILAGFRATPNRVNGLLGISVEDQLADGQEVPVFDESNICGGVIFSQPALSTRYNQVVIRFPDENNSYEMNEDHWPRSDTQTYIDWLAEDNGQELKGEFEFNTISKRSDVLQMAEIIAKRSRKALRTQFSARGIARLVMPNDIVSVTDSHIGWTAKLFRVTSKKESDTPGVFTFEAIEHDDAIYPWSGTEWDEVIGGNLLADASVLPVPSNLTISDDGDMATVGQLTWDIVDTAFVRDYSVTLERDGTEVYSRSERGQSHTIPLLTQGSYVVYVQSRSTINRLSDSASLAFTLAEPVAPSTTGLTVTNSQITSKPTVGTLNLGTQFEFDIVAGDGSGHTPEPDIRARTAVFAGLIPGDQYTVFVRTINPLGSSAWVSTTVSTTADPAEIQPVLDAALNNSVTFNNLSTVADDALDTAERAERDISDIKFDVEVDRRDRSASDTQILDAMADRVSHEWEFAQRHNETERLVGAVVEVDPVTGTIINKAFEYTNDQFSEAQVLIDGVEASVTLLSNRVTETEDDVSSIISELTLLPGVIDARATTVVTEAISALEPAHAFNFFDSAQGWSSVNGTITSGTNEIDLTYGDIENTSLNYVAEDNPALKIVITRTAGTGWTGTLSVTYDDTSTQTFVGIIDNPETIDQRMVMLVNLQGNTNYEGTVNEMRLILGASTSDEFTVESITIGKPDAVVQDIANLQAEVNEAVVRIDSNEAAITQRVTQTSYDANTVTFSNFTSTLDAEQGYIELRGQYQQIIDDDVIAKANDASIVIDGYAGTITALAQTVSDNQTDNQQSINQLSTEIDSVEGTITDQAYSISRVRNDADTQGATQLIDEAEYYMFKWGQLQEGDSFAFAINELEVATGPTGALATSITDLGAQFNTLDGEFESFVTQTNTAISDNEQAIAQTELDLQASIDALDSDFDAYVVQTDTALADQDQALSSSVTDLEAQITTAESSAVAQASDELNARVGYCTIGGEPSTHDTEDACTLAGGTWNPAPLGESVRALRVDTENGTATFAQIGQAFINDAGNPVAKGALITNVNGHVAGMYNTNDGSTSTIDILADQFRVGSEDGGGGFVPKLTVDTGTNELTFLGRLVSDTGVSGEDVVIIDPAAPNDMMLWIGPNTVLASNRDRDTASFFVDTDGQYPRPAKYLAEEFNETYSGAWVPGQTYRLHSVDWDHNFGYNDGKTSATLSVEVVVTAPQLVSFTSGYAEIEVAFSVGEFTTFGFGFSEHDIKLINFEPAGGSDYAEGKASITLERIFDLSDTKFDGYFGPGDTEKFFITIYSRAYANPGGPAIEHTLSIKGIAYSETT